MKLKQLACAVLFVLGVSLLGTDPAPAQDKPAELPQDRLVGEWINDKARPGGGASVHGVKITKDEGVWYIEAWGGGGKVPFGKGKDNKVKLSLLADRTKGSGKRGGDPPPKELPYGFASWESEIGVHHLSLRIEKEQLVVEKIFLRGGIAGDNVTNHRTVETLDRKK
ncbi:MAG: hypothetical protein ABGY75_12075 [Gemmataceae bacterium]